MIFEVGLDRFSDEVEGVDFVLLAGGEDRQNLFDVTAALGTGGALREFSPDHAVPDGAFRDVIRRLDTVDFRKCPETFKMLEQLFANAFGFRVFARQTIHERHRDLCGKNAIMFLERRTFDLSSLQLVPFMNQFLTCRLSNYAHFTGCTTDVDHRLEIPQEMCPAELPTLVFYPVVAGVAIRDDRAGKIFAE